MQNGNAFEPVMNARDNDRTNDNERTNVLVRNETAVTGSPGSHRIIIEDFIEMTPQSKVCNKLLQLSGIRFQLDGIRF